MSKKSVNEQKSSFASSRKSSIILLLYGRFLHLFIILIILIN